VADMDSILSLAAVPLMRDDLKDRSHGRHAAVCGGLPRRRNTPTFSGRRPASASARRNSYSISAFVLRSSSFAQRASASYIAASNRSKTLLRSATGSFSIPLSGTATQR
jgi:hypothetical protein